GRAVLRARLVAVGIRHALVHADQRALAVLLARRAQLRRRRHAHERDLTFDLDAGDADPAVALRTIAAHLRALARGADEDAQAALALVIIGARFAEPVLRRGIDDDVAGVLQRRRVRVDLLDALLPRCTSGDREHADHETMCP